MVFSSLYFTFFFLPLVVAVYYLSKEAYRNCVLLAASLCFYAHGEHRLVLVLLCSIAANYGFALWIGRARAARRRGGGFLPSAPLSM